MPEATDPNRDPEEVRRRLAILDRWCGENAGAYTALWLSCELCEERATHGTNAARACATHNAGFPPLPELPPEVRDDLVAGGCALPPARESPPEPVPLNLPIQWEIGAPGANPDGSPRFLDSRLNRIIRPPEIIRPDEAAAAMPRLPAAGRLCGGCRWFDRRPAQRIMCERSVAGAALEKLARYGTVDPTRMGNCGRRRGILFVYDHDPDCGAWEPSGKLVSFRGQENHG